MSNIPAIYENGVFRPLSPVNLPENTSVEVLLPTSSSLPHVLAMVEQGAAELDRGDVFPAEAVFAELAIRRSHHAEKSS
jgi:predicted DNA-binding antitoxin AbrB/MazE fold protein